MNCNPHDIPLTKLCLIQNHANIHPLKKVKILCYIIVSVPPSLKERLL